MPLMSEEKRADIAARAFGIEPHRPPVDPETVVEWLLTSASPSPSPEPRHQQSYLAHAISHHRDDRLCDDGIVSPAAEMHEVALDETPLEEAPLTGYRTPEHHRQLRTLLGDVLG